MTNKLVVIINSLKEPKIKKILLYEMKLMPEEWKESIIVPIYKKGIKQIVIIIGE